MTQRPLFFSVGLVLGGGLLVYAAVKKKSAEANAPASIASRPELDYLKAVNAVAPPEDPQLLFLLMAAYANANQHAEGIDFLSARVKEFAPRLSDAKKALYLSAIALLRAQHAPSVSLFHRLGYVKDTVAILDQAGELSGGQTFVVNWVSGIVRAQLPGFFHQRQAARDDLAWCVANIAKAPHPGWLREVYFQLGKLALRGGDQRRAEDYLHRSGYKSFDKPVTLITPLSEDALSGHTFASRRITEIIPSRIYALSGFEFTEYYFVVSDDRRELIGIDAGTRPASARTAYEALREYAPNLPHLSTIFVTHSHWDHIGGQGYFRSLSPTPRFYARSNYHEEVDGGLNIPQSTAKHFFGERFNLNDVRNFKPDATVDGPASLNIGGTRIDLIPIHGGETRDAMFIHLPGLSVLFVGDFIMPYLGAPFLVEGDLQGLLDAIDVVVQKNPRYMLHGHELLTRNFSGPEMLAQLKANLSWLRDQVLDAIRRGDTRAAIHQANLIPPGLLTGRPDALQPYLVLREHVIDRLYHQNVGYWQVDLAGLDHLSESDRAELLVDYLGLSEGRILAAAHKMAADGKYELAASLLEPCAARFGHTTSMIKEQRLVYLKLMEKYQNTDPFKYILYSAKIGEQTPQMPSGGNTMKAIRIHNYGDASTLKVEEAPRPAIQDDQILVRVRDAGLNPVDWKIRQGYLKEVMNVEFPLTIGQDFAGEVAAVGKKAGRFRVGDRVFGFAQGSYAEYAPAPVSTVAAIPDSVDFATAASLPTAGLTALQAIRDVVRARPGMTILIHGAAGGVGSFATQIARNMGARVIGTATGADIPYLKSLGVDRVIDYKQERFEDKVREVDAVVDLVGGETLARSYAVVKKGGVIASTLPGISEPAAARAGIRAVHVLMKRNSADLAELAKLVEQGSVKPRLGETLNLSQAKEAQERSETGKTHGKIILKVA